MIALLPKKHAPCAQTFDIRVVVALALLHIENQRVGIDHSNDWGQSTRKASSSTTAR